MSKPVEFVKLKTSDRSTIVGDLYQPSGKTQGAIVLLHQRGGTAADWQPQVIRDVVKFFQSSLTSP